MSFRRQGIFLARGKERATYLLPRFSLAGEMNACHLLRALTPSRQLYIHPSSAMRGRIEIAF